MLTFFENSWLGLMIISLDSRVSYVNGTAEKFLDAPPASLKGTSIHKLPLAVRAAILKHYQRVIDYRAPEGFEKLIHAGKRLKFDMYPDEQGVIVTIEDISREWVKLEAEHMAMLTIDSLPDAVFMVHHTGMIVNTNDRACSYTGRTRQELREMMISYVLPGLGIGNSGINMMDTGRDAPWAGELGLFRRDGSTMPVEVVVSVKKLYGLIEYLVIARDITRRKRNEKELNKLWVNLEKSQEIAHLGSWELDLHKNHLSWSDEVYRIFGMQPQEFEATYEAFLDAVHPDDREAVDAAYSGSICEGRDTYEIEHRIVRKSSGEVRFVHEKCEHYRDESGKIIRSVGMVHDITERRRAEETLLEAKQQAELYLDLMGHDISNMHQIILGRLELAQELIDATGRLEGESRELVDTSIATLLRSVKLINNIRNVQKLRSGEYQFERIDLGEVLEDAVQPYRSLPDRDIIIDYGPVHGYYLVANPLLKDVFSYLLDNAVKHCKGPVQIGVSASRVGQNGDAYYRVVVEDNGQGVPDDKKEEIFNRLKWGDATARGTGLGLYIVKTLVEGFDGTVSVEDRVAGDHTKGARFVVMLPAIE